MGSIGVDHEMRFGRRTGRPTGIPANSLRHTPALVLVGRARDPEDRARRARRSSTPVEIVPYAKMQPTGRKPTPGDSSTQRGSSPSGGALPIAPALQAVG